MTFFCLINPIKFVCILFGSPLDEKEALVIFVLWPLPANQIDLFLCHHRSSETSKVEQLHISQAFSFTRSCWRMKKGLHPQMQWISYVTQSGRLMHVMMTRIHHVGKVYHFGAKRQMAQSIGQIAKFKRRFNEQGVEAAQENNSENQKK